MPLFTLQVYAMGRTNRVSGLQVLSTVSSIATAAFTVTIAMFEVSRLVVFYDRGQNQSSVFYSIYHH